MKKQIVIFALFLMNMAFYPIYAVINPNLQPVHLVANYQSVLICKVQKSDSQNLQIDLEVKEVPIGIFEKKNITMIAKDKSLLEAVLSLEEGQEIVVFAGKKRPKSMENHNLYYAGGGKWFVAEMDKTDKSKWTLLHDADKGLDPRSQSIMFATFNGRVESLSEMMRDAAADRAYFPAIPFTRFEKIQIAELKSPGKGVAIYDVNNDGLLDLFVVSEKGSSLFINKGNMQFEDKSAIYGVDVVKGFSCDFADFNADGLPDLLVGENLYINKNGKFEHLKKFNSKNPLSSGFADINKDGLADIIISLSSGGLNIFLNKDGQFFDNEAIEVETEPGYFDIIDFNDDGYNDIIHSGGGGKIIFFSKKGVESVLDTGDEDEEYEIGTVAAGWITSNNQAGAFMALGNQKTLIEYCADGSVNNVMRYGNEIQDPASDLFLCIAEDLNADGTIDIYSSTKNKGSSAFYVSNRGYGSFILDNKYSSYNVFPPEIYTEGANAIAAADIDGDGANDMLFATLDSKLILLHNLCLKDLPMTADKSTTQDNRRRYETRILTVRVEGKTGVKGAQITVKRKDGEIVARRQIGSAKSVGCSHPNQSSIAIRNFGTYTVEVKYSDGTIKKTDIALKSDSPRNQIITINKD